MSLVVLAVAPAAEGAPRYAAAHGSGPEPCAQAAPCSLKEAVGKAKSNDEVIVAPGSYALGNEPVLSEFGVDHLDVHGVLGEPAPKLMGAVSNALIGVGGDSSLRHLDVVNTGPEYPTAIVCGSGALVQGVRATAVGQKSNAIFQYGDCVVRDSLARADGSGSSGLNSGSSDGFDGVARNLTAIATGPGSAGVRVATVIIAGAQSHALDLKNTIASGQGADLRVESYPTYGVAATLTVSNSNFDSALADPEATINDAGGNQSAAPLFLDAVAGDYREAPGSPTIDAGSTDGIGTVDLDGGARVAGSAPDIGAYEFMPAVVPPAPPGEIRSLRVRPGTFRAVNFGGAVISARKAKAPVSATVEYELTAAATVRFTVERKLPGRKAGKKCVKKTKANAGKKRCPLFRPVKGGFSHSGAAGASRFTFTGRLTGALPPGGYRLTGRTATSSREAAFKIVK